MAGQNQLLITNVFIINRQLHNINGVTIVLRNVSNLRSVVVYIADKISLQNEISKLTVKLIFPLDTRGREHYKSFPPHYERRQGRNFSARAHISYEDMY